MTDSHVHLFPHQFPGSTHPDRPPNGPYPIERVEAFVEAAARRGVDSIAFTEHFYRCVESAPLLGSFWSDESAALGERTRRDVAADRLLSLERYVDVILRAKDAGLPVLLGLEVDFFPDSIGQVSEFLAGYPWDILVGSVHWIGGWGFDKPHSHDEWGRRGHRRAYEEFFALESELAASGLVDVIAHPDRIKMSGVTLRPEPVDLYRELVEAAVAGDVAVELNSGGLRHPVGQVYPGPTLLAMFASAGLDLVLASDAHTPADAAWGLDGLRNMAERAGFTHIARFANREKIVEPIRVPPLL